MEFKEKINEAVEQSVIATVRKGDWLRIDYTDRMVVPSADLRAVYAGLDMGRVMAEVRAQVEQHIADSIMNAMATEVATDVKKILSNQELREDIRAVVRSKLREFTAAQ